MKQWIGSSLLLFAVACKRETRLHEIDHLSAATVGVLATNTVWPGPTSNEITTNYQWTNLVVTNSARMTATDKPTASELIDFFQKNGWSMSEGKRIYAAFNCVGCHAHGGGGMGPALMDLKWIYGNSPGEIFASITEGRPNGMPAFRDRITEYMVWELVAYVRSMSGLAPMDAAPSRDDHLQTRLPENTIGAVQKANP